MPVYILHWNRPSECLRTVESFLAQGLSIQVTVIDNASEPELVRILSDGLPSHVGLVRLLENRGWGGGFNVLLAKWLETKESDYCFVSAHDSLLQPRCLRMLLDSMQGDSNRIGIACPGYGEAQITKFSPVLGPRLVNVSPRPPGTIESVPWPHGTLMIFKRLCLEEIGLFDERYFAYGDEMEIGLRATSKNWGVALVWGAVVVNPGSWTPQRTLNYLASRNSLLLARTYGGWLRAALRALLMVPNTLRLFWVPASVRGPLSVSARAAAIRDFIRGRYGPPPLALRK